MKSLISLVGSVILIGGMSQVMADEADTESYAFDPDSSIFSEHVMPSVDHYEFDPDSQIFSEYVMPSVDSYAFDPNSPIFSENPEEFVTADVQRTLPSKDISNQNNAYALLPQN